MWTNFGQSKCYINFVKIRI